MEHTLTPIIRIQSVGAFCFFFCVNKLVFVENRKSPKLNCNLQETAVMALKGGEVANALVRPTAITIQSAQAPQMKSLVHAYMVRLVLPRIKKEEAKKEKKAKKKADKEIPIHRFDAEA